MFCAADSSEPELSSQGGPGRQGWAAQHIGSIAPMITVYLFVDDSVYIYIYIYIGCYIYYYDFSTVC